jgi:hypothetical protein
MTTISTTTKMPTIIKFKINNDANDDDQSTTVRTMMRTNIKTTTTIIIQYRKKCRLRFLNPSPLKHQRVTVLKTQRLLSETNRGGKKENNSLTNLQTFLVLYTFRLVQKETDSIINSGGAKHLYFRSDP